MTDPSRPDPAAANSHVLFVAANGGWRNVARVAVGLGMSADDVLYAGDLLWELGQTAAATACLRASGWMSAKPSAKRAMGRVFVAPESIGIDTIGDPSMNDTVTPLRTYDRSRHDRRPGVVCVCAACLHTGVSHG